MKYLRLIRTSFLEILEYRANLPIRSVSFFINLSLTLFLWLAIAGSRNQIFGYTKNELILYYLFLSAVLPLVSGGVDFAQRVGVDIKNGDLGGILLKPLSPFKYYLCVSIAEGLKDFFVTVPFVIVLGYLFRIELLLGIIDVVKLIIALAFTFSLSHLFMGIVGLMAFWTTEIGWTSTFVGQVVALVSGVRFPTSFYPHEIFNIVGFSPFLYFGYFPGEIFLRKDGLNFSFALGIQLFWLVALFILLKVVWKNGVKKYEGASQ